MACRSCDLKRIYRLFEEKKRREAEEAKALAEAAEAAERDAKEAEEKARLEAEDAARCTRKKKTHVPVEPVVEPVDKTAEEVKAEDLVIEKLQPEDDFGLI